MDSTGTAPRAGQTAADAPLSTAAGASLALAAACLWGLLPVALGAVAMRLDPVTITWFRFAFAAVLLGALLAATGRLQGLFRVSLRDARLVVVVAGALLANFVLFAASLRWLSPAAAQSVSQAQPVLLMLSGLAFYGERFTRLQAAGAVALTAGLVAFLHGGLELDARDPAALGGVALAFLATVAWVAGALVQRRLQGRVSAEHALWYAYAAGALLLLPFATPVEIGTLEPLPLGLLLFCGLNTVLAYGAFTVAVRRWKVARVGAIVSLQLLVTYALDYLVGRSAPGLVNAEDWTLAKQAGGLLIAAGTLAVTLGGARAAAPDPVSHR